jgi:cell division protein FtsL
MSDAILVAVITSAVTLLGVILSNSKTAAVTNNEIKHLTEEVKKHNNFAQRIPVVEVHLEELEKRVEALERRDS